MPDSSTFVYQLVAVSAGISIRKGLVFSCSGARQLLKAVKKQLHMYDVSRCLGIRWEYNDIPSHRLTHVGRPTMRGTSSKHNLMFEPHRPRAIYILVRNGSEAQGTRGPSQFRLGHRAMLS